MASLLPEGKQKFFGNDGLPMVGGMVYTYDAGTSTPRATYSDADGLIPNPWPVVLDARGEAVIFWSGAYKVNLRDPDDVDIWTVDGIQEVTSDYRTSSTGSVIVPAGTTAQRDAPPATGYFRFNLTLNQFEGYDGADWKTFIGSSEVQQNTYGYAIATGTDDAIIGEFTPDITTVSDGIMLRVKAIGTNATTTPTFTPNSGTIGVKTIVKWGNVALVPGDIQNNAELLLMWASAIDSWVLLNPYIFPGVSQNIQTGAYALVLSDNGKHVYHDSITPHVFTVPANASVAFPIGTTITIINPSGGGVITLSITSDTMVWAGVGSTGSRSIAAASIVTLVKVTPTVWMLSGVGLS